MRMALAAVMMVGLAGSRGMAGELVEQVIEYEHEGAVLEGFLVYDAEVSVRPLPGVLVVHEWWGLNDFAREQARQLARAGYAAFALDMYGKGKVTDDAEQAAAWAGAFRGPDAALMRTRAAAGLEVLRRQPQVDPDRLAAIGFCFGGTTVLQLAYSGASLRGVVSFHGSLPTASPRDVARTRAAILVLHGAADPHVPDPHVNAFTAALAHSSVDWQLVAFGGALHSFTNPAADERGMPGVGYDAAADRRGRAYMHAFFEELFAD